MTESSRLKEVWTDPEYVRLRRQSAVIRWSMSAVAIFAYGSYCWLTGYRGAWFSAPIHVESMISTGLVWMTGSILLLVASEVMYEWYCRRKVDPLREKLAARYAGASSGPAMLEEE